MLSNRPFDKHNKEQTIFLPTAWRKHVNFLCALMHGIIFTSMSCRIIVTLICALIIMVFLSTLEKEMSKDYTVLNIKPFPWSEGDLHTLLPVCQAKTAPLLVDLCPAQLFHLLYYKTDGRSCLMTCSILKKLDFTSCLQVWAC